MRVDTVTTKVVYLDEGELGAAMQKRGMTDRELAERSGHSLALIQMIMEGRTSVTISLAVQICVALGLGLQEIFENSFD